jgi:hypothetical protein
MKPIIATIAAVLAFTFALVAHATEAVGATTSAGSVAGMLQRKHDAELRTNLVAEGRWEEIRQLDEATLHSASAQRTSTLDRINKQLARDTGASGAPINEHALDCDADVTHVR